MSKWHFKSQPSEIDLARIYREAKQTTKYPVVTVSVGEDAADADVVVVATKVAKLVYKNDPDVFTSIEMGLALVNSLGTVRFDKNKNGNVDIKFDHIDHGVYSLFFTKRENTGKLSRLLAKYTKKFDTVTTRVSTL